AGRWVLAGGTTGFDTWHHEGQPTVVIEGHAPDSWAPGLTRRGHTVEVVDAFAHAFGHAHVIVDAGDHLAAGTDPRPRSGSAAGY
ncbi:MAG TPA: gamma-glutamyltranspeptidase, partial [Acidimicrobiales bacterium]